MSGIKLSQYFDLNDQLLGSHFEQFLAHLGGPAVLHVKGKDSSRCRVIVTLLHGNEPSGLRAIYRLLKEGVTPTTNVKIIIGSVSAARTEPLFTNRMLPGQRDLNRCFNGPEHDIQGQLAKAISGNIADFCPEAIVDVHNTSGSGPSFCVAINDNSHHQALASHFSRRYIYADILLGSLMEQNFGCPIVTVEAGGAQDVEADKNAYQGLMSYFVSDNLFSKVSEIELLRYPRRLELCPGTSLNFAEQQDQYSQVTLNQDVEKYNFGVTQPSDILGWTNDQTMTCFQLDKRDIPVSDYFHVENGQLKPRHPLKLFMVTTKPEIAKTDCLFYFVKVKG